MPCTQGIKLAWALKAERTRAVVRGPGTSEGRVEPRGGPESGRKVGCGRRPPGDEDAESPGTRTGGGDPVARGRAQTHHGLGAAVPTHAPRAMLRPARRSPPRAGTSVPGPLPVARPANSYRAPATCQAPRGRHRGHQDETATVSVLPRRATSYDDFKRHWKTAMFSHRWRVSPPLTVGD